VAQEVFHVSLSDEGPLDDVLELAQEGQLLIGRELAEPAINMLWRRRGEVPFSIGPNLVCYGNE
jgi:hypothetical protein